MIKVIVKEHIIPAGSAIASYEATLSLGNEVKKVEGYYVQVLANGGLIEKRLKVSFSNTSKTIFEPITLGHLTVGEQVKIEDRFFTKEPFEVSNGSLTAKLVVHAVPLTDVIIQYIFLVNTEK